jgi:hypothetical protein
MIQKHYPSRPKVRDVLLYFYDGDNLVSLPELAGEDFTVIRLCYPENRCGNFIELKA